MAKTGIKASDRVTVYHDRAGNKVIAARCETCEGHGCGKCRGLGFVYVDENVARGVSANTHGVES